MNLRRSVWILLALTFFIGEGWAQPLQVPVPAEVPLVTTAAIQAMKVEAGKTSGPVRIQGVVTVSNVRVRDLFIEDHTGGIYCDVVAFTNLPPLGSRVEAVGVVRAGAYLPILRVESVRGLGPGTLPEPRAVTHAEAWSGRFDGDRVRVRGQVTTPRLETRPVRHWVVPVAADGSEVNLVVADDDLVADEMNRLSGAYVGADGVLGVVADEFRKPQTISVSVGRREWLTVLTNGADVARMAPHLTLAQLFNATSFEKLGFVRSEGTVAMMMGSSLFLTAPGGGVRLEMKDVSGVQPGDRIEFYGIAGTVTPERRIRLAQVLSRRPGLLPEPEEVELDAVSDPANIGRRVAVRGEFIYRVPRPPGNSMLIRSGDMTLEVRARQEDPAMLKQLRAGAELRLTGVVWYLDSGVAGTSPQPRLLVTDAKDVAVLTPAPWPMRRTLGVVSGLAGALAVGLVALLMAHRRLRYCSLKIERAESELRAMNAALEQRIRDRTSDVEAVNEQLRVEATERVRAQVALAERETRIRSLVESVNAIVWEFDLTHNRFTYVSPQAAALGFPMEDWMVPNFWQDHIHPEDREAAVGFCLAQTEQGLSHDFQYRFATASGDYIWVDDKVTVVTTKDGARFLRGVLIDITDRRRREDALRETEERFAKAFHGSPAVVVIATFPEGVILDVNDRLTEVSGFAREQLIGKTTLDLGLWDDPTLRVELISRLSQGEAVRNFEYTAVDRHRRRRTMLASVDLIVVGGRKCMLSINQDITDRKIAEVALQESEERFAKAFQASPAVVIIVRQSNAQYIDVNDAFTRVFGFTREETIGRTSLDLGLWLDLSERDRIIEIIESGGRVRDVECHLRSKNGDRVTLLGSIETIVLKGENCLLGIYYDITARDRAEHLRDEQNAVLEMVAQGAPLGPTLDRLVRAIESQSENMRCSILLFEKETRRLLHGAAPGLPEDYNQAIHGLLIGPEVGSCGSAAFLKQQVVVEDVESDPRWAAFAELASKAGIRACWSTPIVDSHQQLLGTFAMYYSNVCRPDAEAQRLLAAATHTAAICIKSAADDASLRETARTLRHQNEVLHAMGEVAQIGAWSLDVGSQSLTWTEQTYRIHEIDPSVRPDTATAISFYAPEARPLILAAVENGLKSGQPWDLELPFITAKGRHIWVRAQGQAEFVDGKPVRLHGAFQDITARKQTEQALRASEERFQLAMRGANDGLWDWNLRTNESYYSPRWKSMLGYAENELPSHLDSWKQLVDPDDRDRVLAEVATALSDARETFQTEFRMRHKDGQWVNILSRAFVMRDAEGLPERLVGTHVDITERKRSEEVHRHLEVQLRQSQKMEAIGTLAGGVAHDFNNLLGAIIGCAELARMDCPGNLSAIENLNDLLKASHRAKDLVRQILTFSRQQPQERRVTPLKPVVEESIRLLRAALPASVKLCSHLDQAVPSVLADAGLIQQVIMNLVTNAAQAIGGRPGQVDVSLSVTEADEALRARHAAIDAGPQVLLRVRDNGAGMDQTTMDRIFEPFFTTKGPGHGTGLGLSVVHGIVRSHDGFIQVESQPGEGTTFSIYLPVAVAKTEARPIPLRPAGLPVGNERILLVDDELALLKVVEKILRNTGYDVTACSNPAEALEIFRQSPAAFSLVITDYAMPGQTGDSLARELLAIRPDMPIVVCTGYTSNLTREQALQIGFRDMLQKPVELEQMCHAVRNAIDSSLPIRQP